VTQNVQGAEKDIKYKIMNMNNSKIIKLCVPFLTYEISYATNVDFTNKNIFKVRMSHIKSNVKHPIPFIYDRKLDLPSKLVIEIVTRMSSQRLQ